MNLLKSIFMSLALIICFSCGAEKEGRQEFDSDDTQEEDSGEKDERNDGGNTSDDDDNNDDQKEACLDDEGNPIECPPPKLVTATGYAYEFSVNGGMIEGAEIGILEFSEMKTVTDEKGRFTFEGLPSGSETSFYMKHSNYIEIQTATFTLTDEGLSGVAFQAPAWKMVELIENILKVTVEEDKCQIASTVTRRADTDYVGVEGTHGEPGATVTITPEVSPRSGPFYFNLMKGNVIFPDRELTETTDDGGVLYVNVETDEYFLEAHKEGAEIRPVKIKCRPGIIVNASPPWGLQVVSGGE